MKKSTLLWCLAIVAVGLLSSALTGSFYKNRAVNGEPVVAEEMELIDWEEAQLPEDTQMAEPDAPVVDAMKLPSQLTSIHLPDVTAVHKPREPLEDSVPQAAAPAVKKEVAPLDLKNGQSRVVPLDDIQMEDTREDESARVMIQAPVRYKLINTLEEYKAFKRKARGSYPEVNFAANRVLVLESDSNLPDNLFEIVDVTREGDKVLVTYRVDIVGMNEKTNTHSVKVLKKSNREIELKQIL